MSLEIDLRAHLLRNLPEGAAGVWWLMIPQGTKVERGLVVLRRIGARRLYVLDGAAGYATASVQVDCWAERAADVVRLAEAVIAALHGIAPHTTIGSTNVHAVMVTAERDLDEPNAGLYRRSLDVDITYTEAT